LRSLNRPANFTVIPFTKVPLEFRMTNAEIKIIPIKDIPQADGGSPLPVFLSEDGEPLWLAYHVLNHTEIAVLKFNHVYEYRSGYPNDEGGHPLVGRIGLSQIENSPRIEHIVKEQTNDKRKSADWWVLLNHWVFRFKETTLEVIGEEFEIVATDCVSRKPIDAIFKLIN